MRNRKEIWITAACALAITITTISLRSWPVVVQAATYHMQQLYRPAPLSALRIANQTKLTTLRDSSLPPVLAETRSSQNASPRPILPDVEEFNLTPPNTAASVNKTKLTVRFSELQAEKLASRIPMTIGSQRVVLQRSATDPSMFVTSLNFDWQKFEQEQALRKQQASSGKLVTVFDGRRVIRKEKMQFLDPAQIEGALQNHQPIQFTTDHLLGLSSPDVYPDRELMMVNTAVVEDVSSPARTFDQCLPAGSQGDPDGAWTFNTLMQNIACSVNSCTPGTNQAQQIAENMLLGMLNSWNSPQSINGFTVLARQNMGVLNSGNPSQTPQPSGFLGNWPIDPNTQNICPESNGLQVCPSLPNAPVRLDAIVNRLDLGADPQFPNAGQLRMIFTATTELYAQNQTNPVCTAGAPFNFIFEFSVPSNYTALTWAQQWAGLRDVDGDGNDLFTPNYLSDLKTNITDLVTKSTSCGGASCLSRIRTNEILVEPGPGQVNANLWEQREFMLQGTQLAETTVSMTPDPRFNTTGLPACSNVNGNTPTECSLATGILKSYINSISTNQTFLTTKGAAPLVPNDYPQPSTPFLESFGDIAHRVQYFQAVCGTTGCQGSPGSDLLLSFTNRPIGVH